MLIKYKTVFVLILIYNSLLWGQNWKVAVQPDTATAGTMGSWVVKLVVGLDSITNNVY